MRWKSFLVAETGNRNSSREGRSITSSTRITKYAFMSLTHTHTHTEYPQRLCVPTYSDMSVKQCRNMNSIRNQITLHLSVLLLALFRTVVHILQAQQYFNYTTVGTQTTLPPSQPLYHDAIN